MEQYENNSLNNCTDNNEFHSSNLQMQISRLPGRSSLLAGRKPPSPRASQRSPTSGPKR